jgi:hypothetical protein
MSHEGGISLNQIDEVRTIALAYDIGTCMQCATAIKAYLKSHPLILKRLLWEHLFRVLQEIDDPVLLMASSVQCICKTGETPILQDSYERYFFNWNTLRFFINHLLDL